MGIMKNTSSDIITVPERALVIASPHIERILNGEKKWEMRSRGCKIRGTIGLIRKGSGQVVGVANITGTKGPLGFNELVESHNKHRLGHAQLSNPEMMKWNIAWILEGVQGFSNPVAYQHPNGAQSWVKLDEPVREKIKQQLKEV